jgi:hypothetical protein
LFKLRCCEFGNIEAISSLSLWGRPLAAREVGQLPFVPQHSSGNGLHLLGSHMGAGTAWFFSFALVPKIRSLACQRVPPHLLCRLVGQAVPSLDAQAAQGMGQLQLGWYAGPWCAEEEGQGCVLCENY